MAAKLNKLGLSRHIPSPTKRAVRQECGFGCVICGGAIYQYEHIDPEWHEAKEHRVSQIALLCGACHDCVTRRFWSKEKIKAARRDPICRQRGFSRMYLDGPRIREEFTVSFGGCDFIRPRCVLRVFGEELLALRGPESDGAPPRVSGRFYDSRGRLMLEIVDNEYRTPSRNWDVVLGRGTVKIQSEKRRTALSLALYGPQHVRVLGLEMQYRGIRVSVKRQRVAIQKDEVILVKFRGHIVEPDCALEVSEFCPA